MFVEYAVFGALVVAALVAAFVGVRRRRADAILDPSTTLPFVGDGTTTGGGGATHHSGGLHDGGGSHAGGFFDGSSGSDGGGGDGH